jgi:hypothetical protein
MVLLKGLTSKMIQAHSGAWACVREKLFANNWLLLLLLFLLLLLLLLMTLFLCFYCLCVCVSDFYQTTE